MSKQNLEDDWGILREAGVGKGCEEEDREGCRIALYQALAVPRMGCHCSVILDKEAEGSLFQPSVQVGPARLFP